MPGKIEYPHPGISTWLTESGSRVLKLHYLADPRKSQGEKIFHKNLKMWLSPWAHAEAKRTNNDSLWMQEQEIDFSAMDGERVFQLVEEATLCQSFPIPAHWTRYWGLDPHPRVPHSSLWCAVDNYGDRWYYRELWPSKIYGKPGKAPEDDNRYTIKQYMQAVQWLESKDNDLLCANGEIESFHVQKNGEDIYRRVIDYAARAFGTGTSDDPEAPNFQQRFENVGQELGMSIYFEDSKKDRGAGIERINQGLKPLDMEDPANPGKVIQRSRIHIFQDKCPELAYQLRTNRWQQLTPLQAEHMDPLGKQIEARKHQTDNMIYLENSGLIYVGGARPKSTWNANPNGVAY
jgi:hypothetical protein